MEEKYGEVEEMNVCDNLGDHLVGNVYVKVRGGRPSRRPRSRGAVLWRVGCRSRAGGWGPPSPSLSSSVSSVLVAAGQRLSEVGRSCCPRLVSFTLILMRPPLPAHVVALARNRAGRGAEAAFGPVSAAASSGTWL